LLPAGGEANRQIVTNEPCRFRELRQRGGEMASLGSRGDNGARVPVLFVAENVTLAQCVRLVTLARGLDARRYDIHFACSEFTELVFAGTSFVRHPIESLSPQAAARALDAGRRLYEKADLLRYIDAERRLIDAVRPALVVGDFRLSLGTSAELMGVPSAVLINAYWSPYARRDAFPVPDHPILGWLGEAMTERYFPRAIPHVFRHFASPLNAARARFGLGPVGDLLEMLTHGSHTLYPDDPWLTPLEAAPPSHRFIGPVLWQPELAGQGGEDLELERLLAVGRPLLYVTLGSSGVVALLPQLVEALGRLPVVAVVATAGRARLQHAPANVLVRPFVRGADMARRAALVISNGGSTTGYQALSQGTPVLGLPSNFDQFLATQAIDRAGAGISVKAREASPERLAAAIGRALEDGELAANARRIAQRFAQQDAGVAFRAFVDAVAHAGRITESNEPSRARPTAEPRA
jgi:UDP:flavonoid glycosyltransferase YjiC (YdhE family)